MFFFIHPNKKSLMNQMSHFYKNNEQETSTDIILAIINLQINFILNAKFYEISF